MESMSTDSVDVDLVEDVFDEALDFLSEKTGYASEVLLPAIAVIVNRRLGQSGYVASKHGSNVKCEDAKFGKDLGRTKQQIFEREQHVANFAEQALTKTSILIREMEELALLLPSKLDCPAHSFVEMPLKSNAAVLTSPDAYNGMPSKPACEMAGIGIELEDRDGEVRIASIDALGPVGLSGAAVEVGQTVVAVGAKMAAEAKGGAAQVSTWLLGEAGSWVTVTVSRVRGGAEGGRRLQTLEIMRGSRDFVEQLLHEGAMRGLLSQLRAPARGEEEEEEEEEDGSVRAGTALRRSSVGSDAPQGRRPHARRRTGADENAAAPVGGEGPKKRRKQQAESALDARMGRGGGARAPRQAGRMLNA